MNEARFRGLSAAAKLVRVVLSNCGPLTPSEVAKEAYVSPERAAEALGELADSGLAEPVCGVRQDQEEVYALTDTGEALEPNP